MFIREYTIYDKEDKALWTTYDEDEAWAKVKLTEGQYVESGEWYNETNNWQMDSETYYTREN